MKNLISIFIISMALIVGCNRHLHSTKAQEEKHEQMRVSMHNIKDPMKDIELLREYFQKQNFFQAYRNGYVYNTVGNCTSETPSSEAKLGWELVHVFQGQDRRLSKTPSEKPNWTMFRRQAPDFYTADNPWKTKGPFQWLLDLDSKVPPELVPHLENSGGHGSPCIARRYHCSCGRENVRINYNDSKGRVEVSCSVCGSRKILLDHEALLSQHDKVIIPQLLPLESLNSYSCKCGDMDMSVLLAIEYSVDSNEGWDFTWLNIVALCPKCGYSRYIWEFETQ